MVAWQSKKGGEGGRGGGAGARRVICPRDRTNILLPPLFGQAGKLMALVSRDDEK